MSAPWTEDDVDRLADKLQDDSWMDLDEQAQRILTHLTPRVAELRSSRAGRVMTTETLALALVEFLTARLDEDEAEARLASPGPWRVNAERDTVLAVDDVEVCDGFALSGPQLRSTTEHIARHDPARVLAEVAFKRRTVEFYLQLCDVEGVHKYVSGTAARQAVETVLLDMAAIWADHPDYRSEWATP